MKKLALISLTVVGFTLSAVGCASQKAEEPKNTASSMTASQNTDASSAGSVPIASTDTSDQISSPMTSSTASDVTTTAQ